MKKVLVAEDELSIREFVVLNLKMNDYEVLEAENGEEAIALFEKDRDIDICILDIMMPNLSGEEVCRQIRKMDSAVGIIMLTAKTQESDKLTSFLYGTDDYVVKPFSPSELIARVDALYNRVTMIKSKNPPKEEDIFGDFVLNSKKRGFYKNGVKIVLTEIEYKIIEYLLHNSDRISSRSELIREVWENEESIDEKIVDVNIRRIRMKVEDNPSDPKHLITVWGQGYRWV